MTPRIIERSKKAGEFTIRLTPAQIGIRLICGEEVRRGRTISLSDRLREGDDLLVGITRKDFGYDLQAWHDYLKESREGGYTDGPKTD